MGTWPCFENNNNNNLWNRFWDLNSGFQSCIASALTYRAFTPALAINNWCVLSFCVSHFSLYLFLYIFDVYMYKGHMCQDTLVEVSGQLSQVGALLLPCVFPGWARVVSIDGSAVHWSLSYTFKQYCPSHFLELPESLPCVPPRGGCDEKYEMNETYPDLLLLSIYTKLNISINIIIINNKLKY